jgi:hypothetical protein
MKVFCWHAKVDNEIILLRVHAECRAVVVRLAASYKVYDDILKLEKYPRIMEIGK